MDLFVCVVSIQLNFYQLFPIGIDLDAVIFFEGVGQVVQIVLCEVFDAKIVEDQYKLSWACFVLP